MCCYHRTIGPIGHLTLTRRTQSSPSDSSPWAELCGPASPLTYAARHPGIHAIVWTRSRLVFDSPMRQSGRSGSQIQITEAGWCAVRTYRFRVRFRIGRFTARQVQYHQSLHAQGGSARAAWRSAAGLAAGCTCSLSHSALIGRDRCAQTMLATYDRTERHPVTGPPPLRLRGAACWLAGRAGWRIRQGPWLWRGPACTVLEFQIPMNVIDKIGSNINLSTQCVEGLISNSNARARAGTARLRKERLSAGAAEMWPAVGLKESGRETSEAVRSNRDGAEERRAGAGMFAFAVPPRAASERGGQRYRR